jgi:hypothetical protein
MRDAAKLHDGAFLARDGRTARPAAQPGTADRAPRSTYRALQALPLARLAANSNEHAHVRAVAILGYN